MRQFFQWDLGIRKLALGQRTLLMGIVNVTPDSFSDGGQHLDPARGIEHALKLLDEGADIIDIGGESTRPGAAATVSAQQELDRILPVIEGVKRARSAAVISVDTYKASVARAAVATGAEIVNDVSGALWDAEMLPTLAELSCGIVLTHMRGRPQEWRTLPPIGDSFSVVQQGLSERVEAAVQIAKPRIVLDPGFGFGKSFDENYPLLAKFEKLHDLGYPLLAGVSRKSFLGRTVSLGRTTNLGGAGSQQARVEAELAPPEARFFATLAAETTLVLKGAHIIRTHDIGACKDAVSVAEAIIRAAPEIT